MQKTHLATWFGVSLTLHLALVTGLIAVAYRNAERTPKVIMVILDTPDAPALPQHKVARAPVPAVVRPVAPATPASPAAPARSGPEAVQSERVRHAVHPVMPRGAVTSQPPEQNQVREVPEVSRHQTTAVSSRPSPAGSAPEPVQQEAEGRAAPEKAQQRYVKEQLGYIRELITKHLVYPPMARKMGWSGKAVVAFTIAEDGSVHAIRVVETSGFPLLDKSALETVRSVAPFPKPPVRAEILVPINFRMMP